MQKLSSLGFSNEVIDWFRSYRRSRKFHVNVYDKFSTTAELRCGVLRGSILGPLLFSLHINNMPQAADCDLFLYADNGCLLYQHEDLDQINKELTKTFCDICDWFVGNKLSIHFGKDKTKYVLFSTKNKKKKIGTLEIKYDNINIKEYSKVTYLSCELDKNLSGEAMTLKVINKIDSRLHFLYRKNRYLSSYQKRLLCNTIIQPHFDYACLAWYTNLNKKLKGFLFRKGLINAFVLMLLNFLMRIVLYIYMIYTNHLD